MNFIVRLALLLFLFGLSLFTMEEQVQAVQLQTAQLQAVYDLQAEIDRAKAGGTIIIQDGRYKGPFVIDKPLHVRGHSGQSSSVQLFSDDGRSVLIVEGDGVQLSDLFVEQRSGQLDVPAISVTGTNHQLSNIHIVTDGMGIVLDEAHHNMLRHIDIEGPAKQRSFAQSMLTREGNGVDLYVSNHNVIQDVTIGYVQDGVYIEQSEGNEVSGVEVSGSRYGFHLMFTENTKLLNNAASGNITGAMVMGTRGTTLIGNDFYRQSQHVHSQGLMMYDAHESTVYDNRLMENLVGLYMESSTYNLIANNTISDNYIGLDVSRSDHNTISENDWVGNMIAARATSGTDNTIQHNYWDGHFGMDVHGEQISAIPFHADLIFPAIISKKSVYQLFADSPGMLFLQHVMDMNREEALSDSAPKMIANTKDFDNEQKEQHKRPFDALLYSIALLASAAVMKIYGGKKYEK